MRKSLSTPRLNRGIPGERKSGRLFEKDRGGAGNLKGGGVGLGVKKKHRAQGGGPAVG